MHPERSGDRAPIVWRGRVLMRTAPEHEVVAAAREDVPPDLPMTTVFTGNGTSIAVHLLEASDEQAVAAARSIAADASFEDPMFELGRYGPDERYRIVRALAVERWSGRYRFCPACGYRMTWTSEAMAQICTNPDRVHRHFPRLDPAIIVLVTHGDRALLGRAARWPPGTYSTLAGFVEPGETLEATIRREVFEEAGIVVGATRYFGSESWPFPRSLMLGFFADAQSTTIALNDAELEDARWFDRVELHALQQRMKTSRPYFDTIARRLIDTWLAERGPLDAGAGAAAM